MVATLAHGHEVQPIFSVGSLIDVGRNRIVAKMMGDYLFFLDDDTLPPAEVIIKLLVHKKDIVTAFFSDTFICDFIFWYNCCYVDRSLL